MKKMIIIIMVVLTLEGYEKQTEASLAKRYFPLNVGNSWTYTNYFVEPNDPNEPPPPPPPPWPPPPPIKEFTFTIIGTEEIDGYTYYIFNDHWNIFPPVPGEGLEPTIGLETLFRYDPNADRVIMRLRGSTIERIRYDFMDGEWNINCNVPAGEFSDCVYFDFGPYQEYLAPNVGNIKFARYAIGTFVLESYTIIPKLPIQAMVDLDPDIFEVKVKAHKKPKNPRKPKGEFLRAFIELPSDMNVADVNTATVNLCLNDTILAAAESPLIVDNMLDVLFRLDLENVGAILGLEVTKVKVDECRIEVTTAAAPSQPIDLIELTVSGDLLYPGSFTGTDAVRVMLVKDDKHEYEEGDDE